MREIKFRAWDLIQKLMLPEVAIYFPADHIGFALDDYTKWVGGDELPEHVEVGEYDWAYLTDGFKLMQYTGLKDKNGIEIYEGDIIRINQFVGEVVYVPTKAMFRLRNINPDYADSPNLYSHIIRQEVIGNIYEHKDLLK